MVSTNREIIFGNISKSTPSKLFLTEIDLQTSPNEELLKISVSHLNNIQNILIHGKIFPSLFMYDNFSLWWFIQPTVYLELKKLLYLIIKIQDLIKQEKPSRIIINNDFKIFQIIKQICEKYDIPLIFSKSNSFKSIISNNLVLKLQKYRYKKITNKKITTRKNIFLNKSESIPSFTGKNIFGISSMFRRKKFNSNDKKYETSEYIQEPIINHIKNDILGIDFDYTFKGSPEILEQRLYSKMDWAPLEIFLNQKNSANSTEFINTFKKTISDKIFQKLFVFDGIFYWPSLQNTFEKFTFYPFIPFYIQIIDSLNEIFKNQPPKAIFLPYETAPYALAFIAVAKKFSIKTYGIQHGIIYQYSPIYSFEQFHSNEQPSGFLLPDYLLLFGDHIKALLEKNGYPKNRLFVLGNPEFFELNKLKNSFSSKDLKKKYNINTNSKVILFTTGKLQPYYTENGKYDYDIQIWKYLLEKFANNDDYYVILKPHPSEFNIKAYEEILGQYSCNNFIIKNNNLREMIYISSIVVSVGSTTLIDSLCFDRPSIQVVFGNRLFMPMLIENHVVITSDLYDLEKNIIQTILNETSQSFSRENRVQFLKDQYNFPDGNFDILDKIL